MKLKSFVLSIYKSLLLLPTYMCISVGTAGVLSDKINLQVYKDFGTNMGKYTAGATDMPIYNEDGTLRGYIPIVPDFGATGVTIYNDASYYGTLVGNQSTFTSAGHTAGGGTVSFCQHYGIQKGSPYFDSYILVNDVNTHTPGAGFNYDARVSRSTKLVTDVIAYEYASNNFFNNGNSLNGTVVYNSGTGDQYIYTPGENGGPSKVNGGEVIADAGKYFTGGMMEITNVTEARTKTITINGKEETITYYTVRAGINEDLVLPKGIELGDSGSPILLYNQETQQWMVLGTASLMSDYRDERQWVDFVGSSDLVEKFIDSTKQEISSEKKVKTWSVSGPDKDGVVTMTGYDSNVVVVDTKTVQAMEAGLRGDTSTIGSRPSGTLNVTETEAHEAKLGNCDDWVFNTNNTTISINGTVDTGAGALYFNRDNSVDITNYELKSNFKLNSAGYQLQENVYLKTYLTGVTGDEWRIIGEGATVRNGEKVIVGGTVEILGNNKNNADLNLGVGVTAILSRSGGQAARNVKINTQSTVILNGSGQIGGSVTFGLGGGILDLNGNAFELGSTAAKKLNAYDKSGMITNLKGNSETTFTYKASENAVFDGGFADGSAFGVADNSILNVVLDSASNKTWTLRGDSHISGNFTVENGHCVIQGAPVAYSDGKTSGAILSDVDFNQASLVANGIYVASGASFTIGDHATVLSDISVATNGSLQIGSTNKDANATYSGKITTNGSLIFNEFIQVAEGGSISVEILGGTLDLNNTSHVTNIIYKGGELKNIDSFSGTITAQGGANLQLGNLVNISLHIDKDSSYTFVYQQDLAAANFSSSGESSLTMAMDNPLFSAKSVTVDGQLIFDLTQFDLGVGSYTLLDCVIFSAAEAMQETFIYSFNNLEDGSNPNLDRITITGLDGYEYNLTQSGNLLQLHVQGIPEPSSVTLGLLGLGALLMRRNRKYVH